MAKPTRQHKACKIWADQHTNIPCLESHGALVSLPKVLVKIEETIARGTKREHRFGKPTTLERADRSRLEHESDNQPGRWHLASEQRQRSCQNSKLKGKQTPRKRYAGSVLRVSGRK